MKANFEKTYNNENNENKESQEQKEQIEQNEIPMTMDIKEDFSEHDDHIFNNFNKEFNHMNNLFFGNLSNSLFPEKKLKDKKANNNEVIPDKILGNNPSTFISKVHCSKYVNTNGKPHHECYESQSIKQTDKEGHDISEKNELYKNSNGIQKASHQCMLDNKGKKIIKQKNLNNGECNEKKLFKGLSENDLEKFDNEYNQYKEKVGFKNNYKVLNQMNKGSSKNNNMLLNEKENEKIIQKRN